MAVTKVHISPNFRLVERGDTCLLYIKQRDVYSDEYWAIVSLPPHEILAKLLQELYEKALKELKR